MNIFVSSNDPIESAIVLDDLRLRKMILESVQILSTVISTRGGIAAYKPTHKNHPCTKWVNESRTNFMWLCKHTKALSNEYTKRFNKVHKSSLLINDLENQNHLIPDNGILPFVNCTNFKEVKEITQAYRLALNDKWKNDKRPPKWTNSSPPEFYREKNKL